MIKTELLLAAVALSAVLCFNAEAKLYKWVDEGGITHYGETIPPEYANRDTKQLEKGRVTDHKDGFDADQQNAIKKETPEAKAAFEAHRRDEALLNSFTNEKEIDLSRDRSLLQIEARINSYSTLLKSAQVTLDDLHKENDARAEKGLKIPQSLTDDLVRAEDRVAKLQRDLDNSQKESESLKARYEADKQRFRELKGKTPVPR